MSLRLYVAIALAIGCNKHESTPASTTDLDVVSPGTAPLHTLRYAASKGSKSTVELVVDGKLDAGDISSTSPGLVFTLELVVDDVGADGRMKLITTVLDLTTRATRDQPGAPHALDTADKLRGTAIAMTLAPDGVVSDVRVVPRPSALAAGSGSGAGSNAGSAAGSSAAGSNAGSSAAGSGSPPRQDQGAKVGASAGSSGSNIAGSNTVAGSNTGSSGSGSNGAGSNAVAKTAGAGSAGGGSNANGLEHVPLHASEPKASVTVVAIASHELHHSAQMLDAIQLLERAPVAAGSGAGSAGSGAGSATKELSDAAQAQLASLVEALPHVAMPLPTRPIGVGAKWRSTRALTPASTLQLSTVTTVEITGISGSSIVFTETSELHGADQTVTQDGVSVDVKAIAGTATGHGTLELGKLAMTGTLHAELHMDMTTGSDRTPMAMMIELTSSIR